MSQADIKNFIKEKKVVIGTNQTVDKLRKAGIEKIFISKNCPESTVNDMEKYSKIAGIQLEKLDVTSEQLGVLCKKQFNISVLGVLKGK